MPRFLASTLIAVLLVSNAAAEDSLPLVEETASKPLRQTCLCLLETLASHRQPLPAATETALRRLLEQTEPDPSAIQMLLDPLCLIMVSINPESRVKAARGPADARLPLAAPRFFLVKVHNDAGVTQALSVAGPQLRKASPRPGQWLAARVVPLAKDRAALTGQNLEYVLVQLTAHEKGKREAGFHFDVGQGTQDLGFRAEVPVLFRIEEK